MLNLVKNRYIYLGTSAVLSIISVILFFSVNLNLGIDMTGGTQSEYSYTGDAKITEVSQKVKELSTKYNETNNNIINETSAYGITGEQKISVVIGFNHKVDETTLAKAKNEFKEEVTTALNGLNNTYKLEKYTDIGKSFGDYIQKTAIITLLIALVSISIYIGYSFSGYVSGISSMHFAYATAGSLLHDIIVCTGFYIFIGIFFPEFKIDTYFITGLLTILGYSINDTVVIFDRIRDNLKIYGGKGKTLKEIVDFSIEETLKRSIYTSCTFIFVLIAIFFFGPEALKGFMLLMILGGTIGTYSSIFIASPILFELNKNTVLTVYKKKVIKDDDKIVV